MSKFTGMTSHRDVVVSYQALYFNLGVLQPWGPCFGTVELAVESTQQETYVQNHYCALREELY